MSLSMREDLHKTKPWKTNYVIFALRKGLKFVPKLKNLTQMDWVTAWSTAFLVCMPV